MSKINARVRRGAKTKARQKYCGRPRLVVYRSTTHIYAQIIVPGENGDRVVASCSTVDKEARGSIKGTKVEQATMVGKLLGERAKAHQITDVAFDRSGYKYHGRVKALADGAREAGLNF
ncbi:50S ribosomal protein L18 [Legionella quinlivanii]|uniref:Large ribosomal subunit protein uL18 n=1 Tax=Legionella quinlivanii TaxID=45073 RepID=A0A0W0XYU2_9GAMM|nr:MULTISPECIES: 50S ribosomal protein L18 [Legionella]KTD49631.1 50S ribosomal protein L18 [Legionella quinlivanii]MCE3044546.1 50S ribosomal protein L18 [Legionella sp. 16cNR16C]MCW8452005.1 50S ribosomal protein L18 [Legionella quinlivanii]RAP35162.1 50S ribosomal protein L18 [Legionella quinlivanii]SEG31374.1 large subunit ribosomal protein L18 [Legionella quinlivanii DSM 21216]